MTARWIPNPENFGVRITSAHDARRYHRKDSSVPVTVATSLRWMIVISLDKIITFESYHVQWRLEWRAFC